MHPMIILFFAVLQDWWRSVRARKGVESQLVE
jgi:hypothetical protein